MQQEVIAILFAVAFFQFLINKHTIINYYKAKHSWIY